MIGDNIWEQAEKYLSGELTNTEFSDIKNKLAADIDFANEFHECIGLIRSMKTAGQRNLFSTMLQDIRSEHKSEVETAPSRTIPLKTYYWRTGAVAASIAILTSLSTFWIIQHNNKQIASQYSLLRRDLEKYKHSQNLIIRDIKQEQTKPVAQEKYTGTGFAVSNDGYFVTNNHVIEGADSIYIQNKEGRYFKATLVQSEPNADIALLKIENKSFRFGKGDVPYTFATTKRKLGTKIYSLGFPQDDIVYNEGYISSKNGYQGNTMQYQLELPANPGQSGAPVIDAGGNIIGIITGKESETEGKTYAVSSKAVLDLLGSLPKDINVRLPKSNKMGRMSAEQQIEKLEYYTLSVRVYKK